MPEAPSHQPEAVPISPHYDIGNRTIPEVPISRYNNVSLPTPSLPGSNSINAVTQPKGAWAQLENQHFTAFKLGFLPHYAMDDPSDDEESPQHELPDSTLPVDQNMVAFFGFYRDQVHPFLFAIDDLDELEDLLSELVSGEKPVDEIDNYSLCLLHAVLAAGAQFSDLAPASRMLKSQSRVSRCLQCPDTIDSLISLQAALNYLGSSSGVRLRKCSKRWLFSAMCCKMT
jgi:hypothetical protein